MIEIIYTVTGQSLIDSDSLLCEIAWCAEEDSFRMSSISSVEISLENWLNVRQLLIAGLIEEIEPLLKEETNDPALTLAAENFKPSSNSIYGSQSLIWSQEVGHHLDALQIDPVADPTVIDYKTGLKQRLHKVIKTRFRGEVREVDYYTDESMSTLVISVQVYADDSLTILGYSRDPLGLVIERWTKRTWWKEDDTPGKIKVTHKTYSHDANEQMNEGRRRRTNVVNSLTLQVLNMLVATSAANPMAPTIAEIQAAESLGLEFMSDYSSQISSYISGGNLTWVGTPGVGDDPRSWLDNNVVAYGWTGPTIRDEIQSTMVEIYA